MHDPPQQTPEGGYTTGTATQIAPYPHQNSKHILCGSNLTSIHKVYEECNKKLKTM